MPLTIRPHSLAVTHAYTSLRLTSKTYTIAFLCDHKLQTLHFIYLSFFQEFPHLSIDLDNMYQLSS